MSVESKAVMAAAAVSAVRYTQKTWEKLFKEKTETEYRQSNLPGRVGDFAVRTAEQFARQTNAEPKRVRIITLDDEFLKFCRRKANASKSMEEKAADYIAGISDDKAKELLIKNAANIQYSTAALQVVLYFPVAVPEEQHYSLDEATKTLIRRYLEKLYGKDRVFVPGFVMDTDTFAHAEEDLVSFADAYFAQGQNIRYGLWNRQKFGSGNIQVVYIPFVTKYEYDSAVIEVEPEITKENLALQPDDIILNGEDYAAYGLGTMTMITEGRVGEKIVETFGREVFQMVAPVISTPEDAKTNAYMMLRGIAREMKKKFGDKKSRR